MIQLFYVLFYLTIDLYSFPKEMKFEQYLRLLILDCFSKSFSDNSVNLEMFFLHNTHLCIVFPLLHNFSQAMNFLLQIVSVGKREMRVIAKLNCHYIQYLYNIRGGTYLCRFESMISIAHVECDRSKFRIRRATQFLL